MDDLELPDLATARVRIPVRILGAKLNASKDRMDERLADAILEAMRTRLGARDELVQHLLARRITRTLDRWIARWCRRRGYVLAEGVIRWGLTDPRDLAGMLRGDTWWIVAQTRAVELGPDAPAWLDEMARSGERMLIDPDALELDVPYLVRRRS